jgi:PAS domain S-box-containing protein
MGEGQLNEERDALLSRFQARDLELLEARNALLGVAARHIDLLLREAFEELAAALAGHTPLGRLVVTVPDGDEQILYAVSVGDAASPLPPFGARYPLPDADNRRIVMQGSARICHDTRLGDAVDLLVARSGYLSYLALPIRERASAAEAGPIVAKLVACFRDVGQAASVPLELFEEAAELFGVRFQRSRSAARERRLAMILESSEDAMLAWDQQGQIADLNQAASRLTGLGRAELMGRPIRELVESFDSALEGEPGRARRTRLRTVRSGCADWLPASITITHVKDDPVVAMHMLVRDVSHVLAAEREAAEYLARVRTLEQEHRTLLDNAPLVIFRLDPRTGELRYLNRRAESLLGIAPELARAEPHCLRAAHSDAGAAQSFEEAVQRARLGLPPLPYEARLRGPNGADVTVRANIYPLTQERRVVAIEGILADISAEHAARTQLVQTDRLSTLGRLAAGVAHEINNPAAFLMLGLEHLAQLLSDGEQALAEDDRTEALELLGQLTESLQRIAEIVRDLRMFAGPIRSQAGGAPATCDVERVVKSALTLSRSQLVERARLELDLAPVPPVLIERGRLAQVLVNLLVNAAQAIPVERGREHRITLATRQRGADVEIEIADTGVGIAPADRERIWKPFFTTKEPGSGTGLGLSISRDIIERAGGSIEVTSPAFDEPGAGPVGSRFVVRLKRSAEAAPASIAAGPLQPAGAPPALTPRKRVLIVEDETLLGQALAQELSQRHEVRLASGGAQALDLLASQSFDVILCDVRMPEVSGESVYAQACARYPACRDSFIFMTGIGFGADLARLHQTYRRPILEKPFSVERLLATIAALG